MSVLVLGEREKVGDRVGEWGRLFSRVTEELQNQIHVSFAKDYVYKKLKSFRTTP